jgi:hypothetical protein
MDNVEKIRNSFLALVANASNEKLQMKLHFIHINLMDYALRASKDETFQRDLIIDPFVSPERCLRSFWETFWNF